MSDSQTEPQDITETQIWKDHIVPKLKELGMSAEDFLTETRKKGLVVDLDQQRIDKTFQDLELQLKELGSGGDLPVYHAQGFSESNPETHFMDTDGTEQEAEIRRPHSKMTDATEIIRQKAAMRYRQERDANSSTEALDILAHEVES